MVKLSHNYDVAFAIEQFDYLHNTKYLECLMLDTYPKGCEWSVIHDVGKNTPTFMESILKPLTVSAIYPNYIVEKFEKYKLI